MMKRQNKVSDELIVLLNSLTLEEVIGLKLELAARSINYKMFNFPLMHGLYPIIKEAVIKYAFSCSRTYAECSAFLGITKKKFFKIAEKYNIDNYFYPIRKARREELKRIKREELKL